MDPNSDSSGRLSKYDMRLNPIYQIDFSNQASGKRLSATKRRVRFRFGFSNADALQKGLVGTECRGEEHEVNLVWSLTSGKRLVLADGQEVHFSKGNRTEGKFETSWPIAGGHIVKLIAYAAPPIVVTPGFRQFDMLLDGLSFFDMPRIYELGKTNKSVCRALVSHSSKSYDYSESYSPRSVVEEDRRLHFAETPPSVRSLPQEDGRRTLFAETPRHVSTPVLDLLEPQQQDHLDTNLVAPVQDEFSPVAATPEAPSFALVSNQIMSAYSPATPNALPALANEPYNAPASAPATYNYPTSPQPVYEQPVQYQSPPAYAPQPVYYPPPQQPVYQHQPYEPQPTFVPPETPASPTPDGQMLTMQPLNLRELEESQQPPKSEMEKALDSLVNLSDITETVETPEQIKAKQCKLQNAPPKSEPLPPTAPDWSLGMNASLSDIRKHKQPKATPAKEVMRTHAFDPAAVHAGMMVVYGTPGIPPAQGFGVPYYPQQPMMMPYPQQQQSMMMSRAY